MQTFKGTITTTGSSEAIRLDKHLFKSHPEFGQKTGVVAQVIGPGVILISLADKVAPVVDQEDPLMVAFLAFVEKDIHANPHKVTAISTADIAEIKELTDGVLVSDDESLPEDIL
jgi:antitoxin PrlF